MHWLEYFFQTLLISFLLTGGLVYWIKKSLNKKIIRHGGAAVIFAFLFSVFLNREIILTGQIKILLLASIGILFFGLWDDWKNINWKKQLLFQFLLGLLLFFGGYRIEYISNPLGGIWELSFFGWEFLAVFFWLILILNSINWLDGKDGLLGMSGIFGAAAIFLVSLRPEVNQPALAILAIIFLAAILGFWFFNFPPSKIIAGTSGSYFVGLFLASLSILAGTKIATALLILILPMLDALRVIWERWREKKSIFARDKDYRHLHYLLAALGWSEKKIIGIYALFWCLALWPELFWKNRLIKTGWLLGEIVLIGIFLIWVKKRQQKNRF